MCKFDEEMNIEYLPNVVYKQLINELQKNSNWIFLAERVSELSLLGSTWVKSLENNVYGNIKKLPAENLLDQLNIRMCNVGILCQLLEDCHLLGALSLLCHPEPLIIIKQPNYDKTDIKIALGKSLTVNCEATGLPPPSYLWYHENLELKDQDKKELNIQINSLNQEGEYKCLISQINAEGMVIHEKFSESIFMFIEPTQVFIEIQPIPFMEIEKGETLRIFCKVQSHPVPKYQWYRDNTKLETQISEELKIKNFSPNNEGKYYCHIKNDVSEVFTQKSNIIIKYPREKAVAKIALLIANEDYDNHCKLKTPKNDVVKLAKLLSEIGFEIICFYNLTTEQTKNAMKIFCSVLSEGVYGLFYFAGHGFKMQESYMLAVDAPKSYLRSDAICESELLAIVVPRDPALLVVILDTCQTVPPKESNPNIHKEIPTVNEYRSKKNLRNLIQAYSTSSHRPSYERSSTESGLYVSHLCKFITNDIPVQKVFEEVGKSIDTWFKGKERNQIPMFALTVTKPYQLTDAIYSGSLPKNILKLKNLINFPTKIIGISLDPSGIEGKLTISPQMKPFLNIIKLSLTDVQNLSANLFNYIPLEKNNLFRNSKYNEFRIHNPQNTKGPLVISIELNGSPIGASKFQILEHVPAVLQQL